MGIMLDDLVISEAIVKSFMEDFIDSIKLDVAIVGAGPAGLMAGYCLAKKGRKVVIFERKLSIGGGMWGGGKCSFWWAENGTDFWWYVAIRRKSCQDDFREIRKRRFRLTGQQSYVFRQHKKQ